MPLNLGYFGKDSGCWCMRLPCVLSLILLTSQFVVLLIVFLSGICWCQFVAFLFLCTRGCCR